MQRRLVLSGLALAATLRLFVLPRLDAPAAADAVVALDGDRPRRLRRALVEEGCAPVLVAFRGADQAPELFARGGLGYETVSLVPDPSTTRGEARGVAALARERGWRSVVVVTSTWHVTRARLIFRRALPCEARFVGAGFTARRAPRQVLVEWPKLALALTLRRSP